MNKIFHELYKIPLLSLDYWRGLNRAEKGDWEKAVEHFKKAHQKKPKSPYINFKLGLSYLKLKKWEKAHVYLLESIRLNPNKVEWYEQLEQSEKRLVKKKTVTKIKTRPNEERAKPENNSKKTALKTSKQGEKRDQQEASIMKEFQTAIITQDQDKLKTFDYFLKYILSHPEYLNNIISNKAIVRKALLKVESELSKEHTDLALAKKIIDIFSCDSEKEYITYLKALYLYRKADFLECIITAQELHNKNPAYIMSYFIAISAAININEKDLAYKIAKDIPDFSKRALAWRYIALASRDKKDILGLYKVYRKRILSGELSLGNIEVMKDMTYALASKNIMPAAMNIVRESVGFLLAHNRPTRFNKKTYRYSTEDYLPEWFYPFNKIEAQDIDTNYSRLKEVLLSSTNFLSKIEVTAFCDGRTLLALYNDDFSYMLNQEINISIVGKDVWLLAQKSLLNSGLYFPLVSMDQSVARLKHLSGITLSIIKYEKSDQEFTTQISGIKFAHKNLELDTIDFKGLNLHVPKNSYNHLSSIFGNFEHKLPEEISPLIAKNNILNIYNQDKYILRLYMELADALTKNLGQHSTILINQLKILGESDLFQKCKEEKMIGCDIQELTSIYEYKPQVILYLTGLENVAYQGNMWLPVLERLPCRVAIVLREVRIATQLQKTKIPVYFMQNMRELESLDKVGVQTILYPANAQKNIQALRFYNVNHFFINHGESDKVVNQSKFLMAYDKLLVAGPIAEQRLIDANLPIREGQIVHVGRPQVELLLDQKKENTHEIRTILYAPTWEGFVEEANYSSVSEFGLKMLNKLAHQGYKIYFKPHPYTGFNKKGDTGLFLNKIKEFSKLNNITLVDGKESIFKYMNLADLLITDISSVLNDFLYTLKPMILANTRKLDENLLHEQYPSTPAAYNLDDPAKINEVINHVKTEDSLSIIRKDLLKKSLGDIPEGYMNRFCNIIMSSLELDKG